LLLRLNRLRILDARHELGLPTFSVVKAGEKFLKEVPKDDFCNLIIFSLKSKGDQKEKFSISSLDLIRRLERYCLKAGHYSVNLKAWHP